MFPPISACGRPPRITSYSVRRKAYTIGDSRQTTNQYNENGDSFTFPGVQENGPPSANVV